MKSRVKLMTEGSPIRLIIAFALPLMLGNMCQQMYTVVDSMVVGKCLGVNALASLGVTSWPSFIFVGMIMGLAQGASIMMANAFGKKDIEELKIIYGNAIIMSAVFGVALLMIGQWLALPMLHLLDTSEELIPDALLYLRITFGGILFIMAYNLLSATLRALGDSKTPLIAMVVASIVNVILDVVFVKYMNLGIAGAAIATVLAQIISMLFCLKTVLALKQLHLKRIHFKIQGNYVKNISILSLPMVLQNFLIAGGGMVVQGAANQFDVIFVAGFTAGCKMHALLEIATSSFGFAMTTYVAQNLGAGKMDRIHKGVRSAMVAAVLTAIFISTTMLLSGRFILSGFVSGTAQEIRMTVDIAYRYLAIMCICLPVLYVLYIVRSSLQGLGNTFHPMISAFAELIMRSASAILLTRMIGADGVFIAEVAAWFGADLVLITSYFYTIRKTEKMLQSKESLYV